MAASNLTAARVRELLRYDPDTGLFTWRVDRPGIKKAGDAAGHTCKKTHYVLIGIDRKIYLAHRIAWLYVKGQWPSMGLDHWDTVRANNRIGNLRELGQQANSENLRKAKKNNKSGFLGVSPHRYGWVASIHHNRKKKHLGLFKKPEDAYAAYIEAKRKIHTGNTL